MQCPECQFENESDARFCKKCGHDLASSISEPTSTSAAPPDPTEIPTSFADDRYEAKEFLGEGGKKKVYKAYDTLLDRDVAFSLIKLGGLDEDSRTRITREAQATGSLTLDVVH
jgi:serine/threonine protein kinase